MLFMTCDKDQRALSSVPVVYGPPFLLVPLPLGHHSLVAGFEARHCSPLLWNFYKSVLATLDVCGEIQILAFSPVLSLLRLPFAF